MLNVPCFYINLKQSEYRKNRFLNEAAPRHFKRLQRFDAVHGKTLDLSKIPLTPIGKL